ncbi:SAV_915 family protein [Streptomyces sp. NPDC008163]|uniref:SAV_915 family protein n=1 Tax=Streptomyces sp. NPDC008163 TaxID=3364818 RepID=UPI0036E5E896
MCLFLYDDEPDPDEQVPAGLLHVPVHRQATGFVLRTFRTPLGERTAVAFTGRARLAATLGAGQASIRLAEPALRALASPLGIGRLVLDPALSAPAVTTEPVRSEAPVGTL